MFFGCKAKGALIPFSLKIRDQKADTAPPHNICHEFKGPGDICLAPFRLMLEYFTDDHPYVATPFFGWDVAFNSITEDNEPNLVIVFYGCIGK